MTVYKIEGKKKSRTCQSATMPHAFNPSTRELEAGPSLRV